MHHCSLVTNNKCFLCEEQIFPKIPSSFLLIFAPCLRDARLLQVMCQLRGIFFENFGEISLDGLNHERTQSTTRLVPNCKVAYATLLPGPFTQQKNVSLKKEKLPEVAQTKKNCEAKINY